MGKWSFVQSQHCFKKCSQILQCLFLQLHHQIFSIWLLIIPAQVKLIRDHLILAKTQAVSSVDNEVTRLTSAGQSLSLSQPSRPKASPTAGLCAPPPVKQGQSGSSHLHWPPNKHEPLGKLIHTNRSPINCHFLLFNCEIKCFHPS